MDIYLHACKFAQTPLDLFLLVEVREHKLGNGSEASGRKKRDVTIGIYPEPIELGADKIVAGFHQRVSAKVPILPAPASFLLDKALPNVHRRLQ